LKKLQAVYTLKNFGPSSRLYILKRALQTMQKGTAVVLLQEVLIRKGTKVKVRRELSNNLTEYKCYIAVGSHVDRGKNQIDRTIPKEYACSNCKSQ